MNAGMGHQHLRARRSAEHSAGNANVKAIGFGCCVALHEKGRQTRTRNAKTIDATP
jgi:hypothetical protein